LGPRDCGVVGVSAYRNKDEAGTGAQPSHGHSADGCIRETRCSGWQSAPPEHWSWGNNADRAGSSRLERVTRDSEAQSGKLTEPTAAEWRATAMERWMAPPIAIKSNPFRWRRPPIIAMAGHGFLEAKAHPEDYIRFYAAAIQTGYQQGVLLQQQ